jgi:hypothetical protein
MGRPILQIGLDVTHTSTYREGLEKGLACLQKCCMAYRPTALERAFILAASGRVHSVEDIREALKAEGFGERQVSGPELSKQLKKLIAAARTSAQEGGHA